ncbi:MAG: GNAT family N-acetyltransferase [Alphaproteobacteria bacterium]|nr:GNAT family N-acetyltransferase [Alphaproteobacteria bacterium]
MTILFFSQDQDGNRIGVPVSGQTPPYPDGSRLDGNWCYLEKLSVDHAVALTEVLAGHHDNWVWLPYGPIDDVAAMGDWINQFTSANDPLFYVVRRQSDRIIMGVLSFLRIDPANRSIEVGHINFAPIMQRTPMATEAVFLTMKWAFSHGYRRFEWKCNILNQKSCRAAERFGLSFEGVFRQAGLPKSHNRDTAWFAAIDSEWPQLKANYETWLHPDNFDVEGKQMQPLFDLNKKVLVRRMADAGYQFEQK